jgi:hypothetical protein
VFEEFRVAKKTTEMETTWRADPVKVMDNEENV